MECHRYHRYYVALVFALFLASAASGLARADNFDDCINGTTGTRIASCSAVIDDQSTTPADLETALEFRSHDLFVSRKFAESMRDIDSILMLNPQSAAALNSRAWTLYRWKNTADGMDDANASLRLNGMSAPTWDTRAHLNQLLGQFGQAFNDYEAAVGLGGENMIRSYQCGLREKGLYKGPVDGFYSAKTRAALRICASSRTCDPLPENEFEQECESNSS